MFMDEKKELNNGKVLEVFLNLRALKQAYEKENEDVADGLQGAIELLTHLSAENDNLKKKISEMTHRLKLCDWVYSGAIQ